MKFVGITGGVGAGKTAILDYLSQQNGVKVMLADEIAHQLMEPGTGCYAGLRKEFINEEVWQADGTFDREALARIIFSDKDKRNRLNAIVHPAVKRYVVKVLEEERKAGKLRLLVLEAALLIEEGYDEICDELWYIYTSEDNRRLRLKASRHYTDEKIDHIFKSQLRESDYRKYCGEVIDNNGSIEEAIMQIDDILKNI